MGLICNEFIRKIFNITRNYAVIKKEKEVITIEGERPFKNREEVKKQIGLCSIACSFLTILGLIFTLVGIISDALDLNIILEPSNWLLLAILFVIASLMPFLNSLMAKHLYGIESEK